ncbi:hypothetical protein AMECASPLE_019639 [Ameca splendens]|uniref:Uncharacterized protein n=1 Tax=Ameca splendens TaxID=208324 RepID=A0ABV0ZBX4_9TELE
MTAAGSRKVQVCKRQGDEAERKRYESHNSSGCWFNPAWFPLMPCLFLAPSVQTTSRSQHPSGQERVFNFSDFCETTSSSIQAPSRRENPFRHLYLS